MELTLQTPSLLFPTISLLLLAYTNRFLAMATLVRNLEMNYRQSRDRRLLQQIENLKRRLGLIRNMQLVAVISLFGCTVSMFLLFFQQLRLAEIVFSIAMILMMVSLALSAEEIRISVRALDLHLTNLEDDFGETKSESSRSPATDLHTGSRPGSGR